MLFHLMDKQFDTFKSSNPYPNLIKLKPILLQKNIFYICFTWKKNFLLTLAPLVV